MEMKGSSIRIRSRIREEDLRTLAEAGRALWMDPRQAQVATIETLSAVTLLDLTPDRATERAATALLERLRAQGGAANFRANLDAGLGLDQPFFRLEPEERFLLVGLHLGRWSYARLGRVFGEPVEQIEARAWSARIRLASLLAHGVYPSGGSQKGASCPQYDPQRPWTQRFLDDESVSGRERVFLQNHLMACDSCRETLNRCRGAYYAIDAVLPRMSQLAGSDAPGQLPEEMDPTDRATLLALGAISRKSLGTRLAIDRSFTEGLEVFVRRRDVRIALAALGALIVAKLLR